MKALLLILFLIYINNSLAINNTKYSMNVYPKKVKPGHIQLLNTGKYKKYPKKLTKKNIEVNNEYTVFPVILKPNVPNASLFGQEKFDTKRRVKKVLPDYVWSLRRKRAIPDNNEPLEGKKARAGALKAKVPKSNAKNPTKTAAVIKRKKSTVSNKKKKLKRKSKKGGKLNKGKTKINKRDKGSNAAKNKKPSNTKRPFTPKARPKRTPKPPGHKVNNDNEKTRKETATMALILNEIRELRSQLDYLPILMEEVHSIKAEIIELKLACDFNDGTSDEQSRMKAVTEKEVTNVDIPQGVESPSRGKTRRLMGKTRRLTAARDALIEDYPYVVSIQKDAQHWCAGALLNPRLVVTTANCLWKASRLSRMEVRAGSRHVDRGGQLATISEVMKHPGWSIRKQPDHDVALVLLDRNFRFSDKIHSVDLPNRVMTPPFEDAWVTSWGAVRRDGIYERGPASLQVFHARLVERGACNAVTQRFGVAVTENFVCLAQTGGRAPCTRDTGAPAVSDGVLWGLASWGVRKLCGTERFPAMFTYLASHSNMDFIVNATHYLMADERHYPFNDRLPFIRAAPTTAAPEPPQFWSTFD